MNPLLFLLLGLGGLMGLSSGSGSSSSDDETLTPTVDNDTPTIDDDDEDTPAVDEDTGPTTPTTSQVELAMVVHDLAENEVVLQIEDGEVIDFGTDDIENYVFAAETVDGSPIGSMVLEYQGQTWLQNIYPYTLEDSPLDLTEGDFEVSVTAYSGPDATGDVIGTGTIAFTTTSEAAEAPAEDPVEDPADEPAEEPADEPADEPAEDPAEDPADEPADEPAEDPAEDPADEPADDPVEDPAEDDNTTQDNAALTMLVWDMARSETVEVIEDGEDIDLGTVDASRYTFAAEMADGRLVGSMLLEYQGQTWLQNVYPYTLEDSPIDLSAGDFEITVTAYSGPNATGTVLGTETVSFSTTSEEPEVVFVDNPAEPGNTPDDEPDTTEDNAPTVVDPNPTSDGQGDNSGAGGETAPIAINGTVNVMAGRVSTLDPQLDDVTALKIVDGLNHGNVTVNPDGTFAVVLTLSDSTANQSFTYEATHSDGSTSTKTVNLNVGSGRQAEGWGTGSSHYMLETDENDDIVVEEGTNHTKIYVSNSNDALSVNDIAAIEGVSVNQVTGRFMAENGYGQSENLAVNLSAGKQIWDNVAPDGSKTSTWLLMERGYEYGDIDGIINGSDGESELHPLFVGAWGTGDKPIITQEFVLSSASSTNLVMQNLQFEGGMRILNGENIIFDSITVRKDEMILWESDSVTIRNSDFVDIAWENSKNGGDWDAHSDRVQGLFGNKLEGLLLEGLYFDHNGWTDGYDPGGDGADGQPPSKFSHNLYLGAEMDDVTLRDTITMRAASIGAQVRSGGMLEDNVLIDNNVALNVLGGDYQGAGPVANYSLLNSNIVTSAGHREADDIGALTWGIDDQGRLTTLVDNIVTHLADPNNPQEIAAKWNTTFGTSSNSAYYDDTIVWNWTGSRDTNRNPEKRFEGLDEDVLNETTIQNFAAQLLGAGNGTIDDLADFITSQYENETDIVVDADLIISYFQNGFGVAPDTRTTAETARFVPDDMGEGVRWDNRLNWSTEDLPGTIAGDSVDLGGNTVIYNGQTTEINDLEFGPDGELIFYGGKLTATGELTTNDGGGDVVLTDSGQLWADGHSGADLDVEVYKSARFANTGEITDTTLTVKGGEAVLATGGAIYGVSDGESLNVHSNWADVGFADDDGGVALLAFEEGSTLSYDVENGRLGSIEEIEIGAFDDNDVRSGIDLGDSTLKIDLAGLNASNGTKLMLMDSDELIGVFDDTDISGLGGRNATITIDYITDSVSLTLSNGNGNILFETIGEQDDVSAGEQALWDALTAGQGVFDENPPEIPEDEEEYLEAS